MFKADHPASRCLYPDNRMDTGQRMPIPVDIVARSLFVSNTADRIGKISPHRPRRNKVANQITRVSSATSSDPNRTVHHQSRLGIRTQFVYSKQAIHPTPLSLARQPVSRQLTHFCDTRDLCCPAPPH
jgi:hypothetical protein